MSYSVVVSFSLNIRRAPTNRKLGALFVYISQSDRNYDISLILDNNFILAQAQLFLYT